MISESKNISKSNRNNKGIKTFALILSIPIFILFFEIVFAIVPIDTFFENRFFVLNRALDYPEIFKRDTNLFWKLRPSQVITSRFFENNEFKINSFGLRGEEIPKQSDKIRIVGLGNSCTFGWRTPENEIYLRQLEKLINSDTALPQVEIINAGVPGYTSFQGQKFFTDHISTLNPDIVLMMFGWNDQWAAADNIPDKDQNFPSQFILDIQDFVSRLKIYRLLRKIILLTTEKPLAETIIQNNQVYRVTFEDFYYNLKSIIDKATVENAVAIVLSSPIPSLENYYPPDSKSNMHYYHNYYNNRARLVTLDANAELIDAAAHFDNYNDLFDDAKMDPIHFNTKGHLVLAEQIYQYLKNNPDLLSKK